MIKKFYFLLGLVLLSGACATSRSVAGVSTDPVSGSNVILITLDGIRWQEFFHGIDSALAQDLSEQQVATPTFSHFWRDIAPRGVTFGNVRAGNEMVVSNPALISLPAYHSIMAGLTTPCVTNTCGRIGVETFPERLVRELNLPRAHAATIASWEFITYSAEHVEGATFANGRVPLADPVASDAQLEDINRRQVANMPDPANWGEVRWDRYTLEHAMRYLRVHRPRFLYVSLNDSDGWAHGGRYDKYIESIHTYDRWIKELVDTLDGMGEYGKNTSLIITTDHGRGGGPNWRHHNAKYPEAKYIWLFGMTPATRAKSRAPVGKYAHIDIRPTIESLMGLKPVQCEGCGRAIEELVR